MKRHELLDSLAAMTDKELLATLAEARGDIAEAESRSLAKHLFAPSGNRTTTPMFGDDK